MRRTLLNLWRREFSASTNRTEEQRFEAVRAALALAIDGARAIDESARQSLLEDDPTARERPAMYQLRYQILAYADIRHSLEEYDSLLQSLGPEALMAMDPDRCVVPDRGESSPGLSSSHRVCPQRRSLALAFADAVLYRRQLERCLAHIGVHPGMRP